MGISQKKSDTILITLRMRSTSVELRSRTVCVRFMGIIVVLVLLSIWFTRHMELVPTKKRQVVIEGFILRRSLLTCFTALLGEHGAYPVFADSADLSRCCQHGGTVWCGRLRRTVECDAGTGHYEYYTGTVCQHSPQRCWRLAQEFYPACSNRNAAECAGACDRFLCLCSCDCLVIFWARLSSWN